MMWVRNTCMAIYEPLENFIFDVFKVASHYGSFDTSTSRAYYGGRRRDANKTSPIV